MKWSKGFQGEDLEELKSSEYTFWDKVKFFFLHPIKFFQGKMPKYKVNLSEEEANRILEDLWKS